jgi:predicted Na+-dependent transporter
MSMNQAKETSMSAEQLLSALFNAAIIVSVIATVLSLGMSYTVKQLTAPLRRVWVVVLMIILNAGVIPAVAWGVTSLFPIDAVYKSGVILCVIGASGPGSLKAAQLARKADLPLAVSLVVILQLVSIIAMPIWAGQVVSGATISAATIVQNLLLMVLIPLIIGLIVLARYPEHATDWRSGLVKIGNVGLLVAIVAGIAANWSTMVSLIGSWVVVASLIITVIAVVLGMLVGFNDPATRLSTGFVSGIRFGSLGLVIIGTQLSSNPGYLAAGITFALIDFIVPLFVAVEIGRRAATTRPVADTAAPEAKEASA